MSKPVQYWFDFVSPYSYIAGEQIEAMAAKHGRGVQFQPFLLGAVFQLSKSAPLTEQYAPKAKYSIHDFERSARFAGVPFAFPSRFPMMSQNTGRATLWVADHAPDLANAFARGAMRGYFTQDAPMNDIAWIAEHAAKMGLDAAAVAASCSDANYKDKLKAQCETAITMGLFGAPTIIVDGEVFWGNDRLPQVERWLATGPF
jgi:2-hydroxychromene-2-carboxylate isomerase